MTDKAFDTALRRDRGIVATALIVLVAAAWGYLIWLAADMDMGGMDMTGFRMIPIGMGLMKPASEPWNAIEFTFVFVMWAVMMIGMMTPSVMPMILLYARVGRQSGQLRRPLTATWWFAAGYLLMWTAFSLAATTAQWALERRALLAPDMSGVGGVFGGVVMIAIGLYQWLPLKDVCLRQCQEPWHFIQRYGGIRTNAHGSLMLGARHGLYCVGCCWMLMALLFVGGVMNVLWIAAITIFVLAEKLVPAGRMISRTAGVVFFVSGVWLICAS